MTPVPTRRAVLLLALGLVPAVLSLAVRPLAVVAGCFDAAVLLLIALDFLRAPRRDALRVTRELPALLSAGVRNRVWLELESLNGPLTGELRDTPPPALVSEGHRQRFRLRGDARLARVGYDVVPARRGDFDFGDLFVRLEGPLRMCARQVRIEAATRIKAFPDLSALTREALALARVADDTEGRVLRRPEEGKEFDSLREYRHGDDYRGIDWKATARRAKPIVRTHQPERNQNVHLLLDCGRHMAGEVAGRPKLEHAVDAALRVAKVCLDQGDAVGVLTFAREVGLHLPPARGNEQLHALTHALYRVEAQLAESDYGAALDHALRRKPKRSLIVLFTDLLDPDTAESLLRRTARLRPRHLPLVASLLDEELERTAREPPAKVADAYVRQMAVRLVDEHRLTVSRLREQGALVLRAPASRFGADAVNEYLRIKARGLL